MNITTAMPQKSPWCRRDEGAVAAEAALTFSLLFTLILGIIQFGTSLWQWNTMELAVLQAGRYAMINNGFPSNPPGCAGGGTLVSCTEKEMQKVLPPSATVSCPLPSSPAASTWYVCATQNTGTSPLTMTLSAAYGYNVFGLVGPLKATSQAIVPLD